MTVLKQKQAVAHGPQQAYSARSCSSMVWVWLVNTQMSAAMPSAVSTISRADRSVFFNSALAAAGVSCPTVDAACLRGLSAEVVNNQLATAFTTANSSPVPSVDGKVLPKSIKATFVAGENNKVPLVNGSTQDEWSYFVASRELVAGPLTIDRAAHRGLEQAFFLLARGIGRDGDRDWDSQRRAKRGIRDSHVAGS